MLSKAPRRLPQSWSSHPPTLAHYNGTQQSHHVHSSKVGPTKAHCNGTLPWHHVHSANGTTSTPPKLVVTLPPTIAHYNGTLQWHPQQWHHVHSTKVGGHPPPNHSTLQWHLTKAPSNGTTSTAPCNGTLQWHHVHSTIAHYNGTLQRHPAMAAHYNGTLQRHPAMARRPLNHSTLQWHPATAPSNGTTSIQP